VEIVIPCTIDNNRTYT